MFYTILQNPRKGYYCKHDNLEYVKYLLNDKVEYVHHKTKDI